MEGAWLAEPVLCTEHHQKGLWELRHGQPAATSKEHRFNLLPLPVFRQSCTLTKPTWNDKRKVRRHVPPSWTPMKEREIKSGANMQMEGIQHKWQVPSVWVCAPLCDNEPETSGQQPWNPGSKESPSWSLLLTTSSPRPASGLFLLSGVMYEGTHTHNLNSKWM